MKEIIEELEKTPHGSRHLDWKIHLLINPEKSHLKDCKWKQARWDDEAILVWKNDCKDFDAVWDDEEHVPNYTTSLDAAREMSNWLLISASDIGADGIAEVYLGNPKISQIVHGIHSRLATAWCIASLRAIEAEK